MELNYQSFAVLLKKIGPLMAEILLDQKTLMKNVDPDKILPLFDLGVKGQGQMNVMIVSNTSSNGDAPT